MRNVLVIAYYFPPLGMGGVQRVFKFCKYLPRFGWHPVVLTVRDVAYFAHDPTPLEETSIEIHRTESLDPLRLGWCLGRRGIDNAGRWRGFSSWFFIPDSKILWLPFVLAAAWPILREKEISLIFASSPPQTALTAGLFLKKVSHAPLVLDLRDPIDYGLRAPTPLHSGLSRLISRKTVGEADRITAVYPQSGLQAVEEKVTIIPNGFDPEDFKTAPCRAEHFVIAYTGALTQERKGEPFFRSIAELIESGEIDGKRLRVRLVGWIDRLYDSVVARLRLSNVVENLPYVPHVKSVEYLMASSLLWLPVGEGEIPGKVYEYMGSRRPILATAGPGECADLIRSTGSGVVIDPEDVTGMKKAILDHYHLFLQGKPHLNASSGIERFDRLAQTRALASLFDSIVQ